MPQPRRHPFNVRSGEGRLVLVLGSILLGNAMAHRISEIVSVSNFVSDVGTAQFLIVLVLSSGISLFMTGLQSLLVDRFDRIKLMRAIGFALGLAFVLLRVLFLFNAPNWLTYGFLYLLSDQQLLFFPMIFWILANDIFDVAQSKRLFPVLGSLGFVGNLMGIAVTAFMPILFATTAVKTEEILMVNILIYLLIQGIAEIGLKEAKLRKTHAKVETMQETLSEGWDFVQGVPAFRFLTISILGIIICETAIEYHFFVVTEATYADAGGFQIFLSLFTLVRILCYILIQTFITPRLIQSIGIKHNFFIQPISSCLGALSMMVVPGLPGGIAGIVFQKFPQYTIDETARKTLEGFVPEERRGRVSLFLDSYVISVGVILGAILTGSVVFWGRRFGMSGYAYGYLMIGAIAALVATWSIFRMCKVYDSSLLNWRLKRRQRGKSVLDKLDF